MPDVFTKKKRSKVMAAIRARGNKDTELKLISILRSDWITGWRRHAKLPGRPDFVFRAKRVAVFVDGCFWHGCPKHGRRPGTNGEYWIPKLARNKARDRQTSQMLRKSGWIVIRFWEHELSKSQTVLRRLRSILDSNECSPRGYILVKRSVKRK